MAKVIALIPARAGSKGVPNKNVRLLGGHSLLEWSIAACLKSSAIERVIVSTDSAEYAALAKKLGAEAPFLRPAAISDDRSTDYDFIVHALDWLAAERGEPEYLVHIRPTTPLRDPRLIDDAVKTFLAAPYATALRSVQEMSESAYKTFEMVAATALSKGTIITARHIKVRSPGQGLSPQNYEKLLGRILQHDMDEEDFFYPSDLKNERIEPRSYSFQRPWGVPVRYHDFQEYRARIQPDVFEFHLSYSDMELNPDNFMEGVYPFDFVVHAPELFAGSCLMDLASPDEAYRTQSVRDTQRVINITRNLKRFFPRTKRPLIVANVGGFTMDEPLPPSAIQDYYERFAKSLGELDMEGVELIPQTMAPFPWHFGGQRYQNIFVKIEEIVEWCQKLKLRMCFDISHTRLTCNHLSIDFYEFAEKIAPLSAHLHFGDALGLNGEGLQIGDGDIDFVRLGKILRAGCPQASFIPEIWQGHKNGGEGFWIALEKLEGIL